MRRTLILISALALSLAATAQTDNKNAVVNVENDYTPEVVGVTKKDFTPSDDAKPNTDPMTLMFSKSGKAYDGFASDTDVKDALPQKETLFPGYVRLGYGLTNDIDAKAAYRLGVGKNGALKAYAGLDGYKCNVDGLFSEWNSRLYQATAGVGYTQRFKALTLGIDGAFMNSVFNYQNTGVAAPGITDKQDGQNYRLAINAVSHLMGAFSFNIKGDVEYITRRWSSGVKAPVGEMRYGVGAGLGYELMTKHVSSFGVDLGMDAYTYNSMLKGTDMGYNTLFSIDVDPYANLKFGNWNLKTGVKMNVITRGRGAFAIAPDIEVLSNVRENVTVYGSITGGRAQNGFAKLDGITPYWGFVKGENTRLKPTYKIVDVNLGSRISFEPLSMELSAGYAYTQDNLLDTPQPQADNQAYSHLVYVNFGQDDTHHAYAALDLGLDLRSWMKLSADVRYDFWHCNNDYLLVMKPMLTVDANAEFRLIEHLTMRVGYNFTLYTKSESRGRISNRNDLYARVSYQINKRFGAYIQGNNLLNDKYYECAGYLARGIRGSLGATVNF